MPAASAAAPGEAAEAPSARRIGGRSLGVVAFIVLELVIFSQLSPTFLTFLNMLSVTRLNAEVGLIALGMAVVIASGGIDLSVGAIMAVSSVMLGVSYAHGLPISVSILVAVACGVGCGLVNGGLVVLLRLHPLLVTLGTLSAFRGLALGISGGRGYSGFPPEFATLGTTYVAGVPGQTLVWIVVALVLAVLVHRTVTGRTIILIGVNEEPARMTGLRVDGARIGVYALSGLLAGIAGIIFTSRVYSSRADAGNGIELLAIAAVVVGGASIRGGEISVLRTVLATLAIGLLTSGFIQARIDTSWQFVAVGALMVGLVAVNELPVVRSLLGGLSRRTRPRRKG